MQKTLTLQNIPDDLFKRLKCVAETNNRSMSSEVVVCLEGVSMPTKKMTVNERLDRARQLRNQLLTADFDAADMDLLKHTDHL
jgi:antitoxin FitA